MLICVAVRYCFTNNTEAMTLRVNRMPQNRLPWVMKHYSPTDRRNHGIPLKRLLDTWDRNGSTSGPTPWQIYDDDDDDITYVKTSRFDRFADKFNLGVLRHCFRTSHNDSSTPVGRLANKCLCSVKCRYWSQACVSISERECVQQLYIREHNLNGWPIFELFNL